MKIYKIILLILLVILILILFCSITFNRFTTKQSSMDFSEFLSKYSENENVFRKPSGLNYKGKPIILYGCSFTYGEKLNNNETFSYQLANYVKRPVYNFGIKGHCIQHALFMVRKDEHYKNFTEPEYVIYTYIPAHLNRLLNTNYWGNTSYLQYKVKNNHLVQINSIFKFWHPTIFYNTTKEVIYNKWLDKNKTKRYNLMKLYFNELRDAFHKHYPNTKFVILLYDYEFIDMNIMWNDLEKDGFIIYKVSDIANINPNDKEYKNPVEIDRWEHPNKKAWGKIIPELSKKLGLT